VRRIAYHGVDRLRLQCGQHGDGVAFNETNATIIRRNCGRRKARSHDGPLGKLRFVYSRVPALLGLGRRPRQVPLGLILRRLHPRRSRRHHRRPPHQTWAGGPPALEAEALSGAHPLDANDIDQISPTCL
jgi:hypothetical protein